jgi:hypothetical protein
MHNAKEIENGFSTVGYKAASWYNHSMRNVCTFNDITIEVASFKEKEYG